MLAWAPYKLRLERLYSSLLDLTENDIYLYNFGGQLQTVKIATGNYDAYIEVRAETYNEFAGALIAQNAGCIITKTDGSQIQHDPKKLQTLVVARNDSLHKKIIDRLKDKNFEN